MNIFAIREMRYANNAFVGTEFWTLFSFLPYSLDDVHVSMHPSMIVNDDRQDATIYVYLFIPNQLYMFRAMFSPNIRITWMYLQLLIVSTDIAAGWCHGWDGTQFHLILDTSRQQYRCTISETVYSVKCSWLWAKTSPDSCTDDWVQINKPKSCIVLVINYEQLVKFTPGYHNVFWCWLKYSSYTLPFEAIGELSLPTYHDQSFFICPEFNTTLPSLLRCS